ncbi:OadG family protein [Aliidiomarina sp. Khilg15.8]
MNSLLADAGLLMLIGMVTVFCFLLVLTGCVSVLTRVTAEPAPKVPPTQGKSSGQPSAEQMAAISSALQQYRKSR